MDNLSRNGSGCYDPTAKVAITHADHIPKHVRDVIEVLKKIARLPVLQDLELQISNWRIRPPGRSLNTESEINTDTWMLWSI
jgi:hypothetical protein